MIWMSGAPAELRGMGRPPLALITPTIPHCHHFGADFEVAVGVTSSTEGVLVEADDL